MSTSNPILADAVYTATGALDPSAAGTRQLQLPVTLLPHGNLLKYYLLSSVLFGPVFLFAMIGFYVRFRSLRYDLDAEGITMRWGLLFRREISLTYARIQDIQLRSNAVERWLGLARIEVQTASGNASAEMTIEGVPDVDGMRDFLYSRMRGAAADSGTDVSPAHATGAEIMESGASLEGIAATLAAAADELRLLRLHIESERGP
jgi:membrane protein YdbS with pleckstrin-like domain